MSDQSKQGSFIEAVSNVFTGFLVTLIFSPSIYWVCGVEMQWMTMGKVTLCFTVLSVIRSYVIRRFFNKLKSI